jgi:hypothetical protein
MKPSICICCGEPIVEPGNALSRNPNICASCSSLADGMEQSSIASMDAGSPVEPNPPEAAPVSAESPKVAA